MKLAEALSRRSELVRELSQYMRTDLNNNLFVTEGDPITVDKNAELSHYLSLVDEVETLTIQINRSNNAHVLDNGLTIMEAIARRDMMKHRTSALSTLASNLKVQLRPRYSADELRTVPVADFQPFKTQSDALAKEAKQLDLKLQEANWTFDLIES